MRESNVWATEDIAHHVLEEMDLKVNIYYINTNGDLAILHGNRKMCQKY